MFVISINFEQATKLQDASNGSSQSQSAGRAWSSSQSQALNRPRAGSTLSHAAGSVSSQVHTISDSDDEMEPTSRPPSFLTQVIQDIPIYSACNDRSCFKCTVTLI